jgi:hypothetical protein
MADNEQTGAAATQETEQNTEEVTEEQVAETQSVEEPDTEGLPADHKERSDLGRKVSATHRRLDEYDNRFQRIEGYLEKLVKPKAPDPAQELNPDEPVTVSEMQAIMDAREKAKEEQKKTYLDSYQRAVSSMGPDLSEGEWEDVLNELKTMHYDPSDDPVRDAKENFLKADNIRLRKKAAQPLEKQNPLQGGKPQGKLGVATNQNAVVKETAQPKLDADAKSYMDYVRRTDGDEAANKLTKDAG